MKEFKKRDFPALRKKTDEKLAILKREQEKIERSNASKEEKMFARNGTYFFKRVVETAERFVS